jgi:hypothetical protein
VSAERNKALVRRFHEEVFCGRDLSGIDRMVTPNFVQYLPGASEPVRGPESFEGMGAMVSVIGGRNPGRVRGEDRKRSCVPVSCGRWVPGGRETPLSSGRRTSYQRTPVRT